jgi:hypothetical protein
VSWFDPVGNDGVVYHIFLGRVMPAGSVDKNWPQVIPVRRTKGPMRSFLRRNPMAI